MDGTTVRIDSPLQACGWCITATLIKDLSHKYLSYEHHAATSTRHEIAPDLDPKGCWCVVGDYDFLRFEILKSLEAAEAEVTSGGQVTRRLMLIPLRTLEPLERAVDALCNPAREDLRADEFPLVVLTRIVLAPQVHHLRPIPGGALAAVKILVTLMSNSKIPRLPYTAYFGSLSNPDLVVISFPKTPEELIAANRLLSSVRTLGLADLAATDPCFPASAKEGLHESWPGAACASLVPLLAWRRNAYAHFTTDDFKNEEKRFKTAVNYRLRVDCGHEGEVAREMRSVLRAREREREDSETDPQASPCIVWDTPALTGSFQHLADLIDVWKDVWFDARWRRLNLLDGHLSISMPNDERGWEQGRAFWRISDGIHKRLDFIRSCLHNFSSHFLNSSQRAELRGLLQMFYSSFLRLDLFGVALDIYPFLLEVARVFQDAQEISQYLDSEDVDIEEGIHTTGVFQRELDGLLQHLGRAIRSRLEDRVSPPESLSRGSFEHGASKLLSAYTEAVYASHRLFAVSPEQSDGAPDSLSQLGVCVTGGTTGMIACEEAFRGLRRFGESRYGRRLGRLLLCEVSGPSLFRPDESILHVLRTVSGSSGWIHDRQTAQLRRGINRWVFREACGILQARMARKLQTFQKDVVVNTDEKYSTALRRLASFSACFTAFCTFSRHLETSEQAERSSPDWTSIGSYMNQLMEVEEPCDFLRLVWRALATFGSRRNALSEYARLIKAHNPVCEGESPPLPPEAYVTCEVASSEELGDAFATLDALTDDVIGDVGAWGALHCVLSKKGYVSLEQRLAHVSRFFGSLFRLLREWQGAASKHRVQRALLHRLALQAGALSPNGANLADVLQDILRKSDVWECLGTTVIREVLHSIPAFSGHFGNEASLVAVLKEFSPYGGPVPLVLVNPFDSEDATIWEAFLKCWDRPETGTRANLLLELWARSSRSAASLWTLEHGEA